MEKLDKCNSSLSCLKCDDYIYGFCNMENPNKFIGHFVFNVTSHALITINYFYTKSWIEKHLYCEDEK